MQRRKMLRLLTEGAVALGCSSRLLNGPAAIAAAPILSPGQLARLAMTTVCLRDRIPTTPNQAIPPVTPPLQLVDAPRFIKSHFGLTNIEVWNFQFPDDSDDFCRRLRDAACREGGRIINLQLDGSYDLSSIDADERRRSIDFAKQWLRRASLLGSPTMRVNLDSGSPSRPFDPAALVPIIRELADHGRPIGVKLLVENHIGHSKNISNVVKLLSMVNHPNVGGLLDWGNSDASSFEERLADFSVMFPDLSLVSAKGLHFDAMGRHVEYPIAPIVTATEKSGYRGLYSIELYTEENFPDPIIAVNSMIAEISRALADAPCSTERCRKSQKKGGSADECRSTD